LKRLMPLFPWALILLILLKLLLVRLAQGSWP
jgi:hypothetical protein